MVKLKKIENKKTKEEKLKKIEKEKQTKQKITAKMTFNQVISKYPETSSVFFEHGMGCLGCPVAMQETIEQGCKAHGINVKKFLAELNKKVKEK